MEKFENSWFLGEMNHIYDNKYTLIVYLATSIDNTGKPDIKLNGWQKIDGVLAIEGNYVLVKDSKSKNGVYRVKEGEWEKIENQKPFIYIASGITQVATMWADVGNNKFCRIMETDYFNAINQFNNGNNNMSKEKLAKEIMELVLRQKVASAAQYATSADYRKLCELLTSSMDKLHSLLDQYFYESKLTDDEINKIFHSSVLGWCKIDSNNVLNFARAIERIVREKGNA